MSVAILHVAGRADPGTVAEVERELQQVTERPDTTSMAVFHGDRLAGFLDVAAARGVARLIRWSFISIGRRRTDQLAL